MKVIFLDIDGVLNCHRTCLAFGGMPFKADQHGVSMLDGVAIALIRNIAKAADAKFVLSSTWRILNDFRDVGDGLGIEIIDQTARGSANGELRGNEIQDWLDLHENVSHYAIIDDDVDMLASQMNNFVKTSGFDGFTWKNAEELAKILVIDVWDGFSHNSRVA